jgi:hypothetical protein
MGILAVGLIGGAQAQEWRGTAVHQTMSVTPAARTGASGSLSIEGSTITLEIEGLGPGNFQVAAVNGDGDWVNLGIISIVDPSEEPQRETGDSRNAKSVTHERDFLSCRVQLQLPGGFNPAELQQVLLLDLGGNVLLAGPSREK